MMLCFTQLKIWEGIKVLNRPNNSPDTNPIENMWDWMIKWISDMGKLHNQIDCSKVIVQKNPGCNSTGPNKHFELVNTKDEGMFKP
ncbi:hypothetical protein ECANGB1_1878 [Enterospora canceri]|uniref:Uncharacterized protein n=1 Tax=Enterospora canceri TaxID=1081671 RepID=A0A1Y1SA47_9MICR|nr:hypothetical protein ECANGB1_1878 [Enterospora canceri]